MQFYLSLEKIRLVSISCILSLTLFLIIDFHVLKDISENTHVEQAVISTPIGSKTTEIETEKPTTIWDELSSNFSLDHRTDSRAVKKEIHKLLADKQKLYSILDSSSPYIHFIFKQVQEKGLPAELALIPAIESEFNPNDHSKKGATGLWQLMPGTARDLGLKFRNHVDPRKNFKASTNAALTYFNDLGNLFKGNWYLAIAAYNCGEVRVKSAERHAGSTSFWNLSLPKETKVYVPKLLAVAAIIENPQEYNVELPEI